MRNTLVTFCFFFGLVGCAHVDRHEAMSATVFDVMSDAEIARLAVAEALGELHVVERVDAEGTVTSGKAAFHSRDERLAFERRVDFLLRKQVYGQGPALELLRTHCQALQRTGWRAWPKDLPKLHAACEYGDTAVTLHSVWKKPMLQRALLDLMVPLAADPLLEEHVAFRLQELSRRGVEPYQLAVERWDRIEGFRPRG